jgi:hypothetical protein
LLPYFLDSTVTEADICRNYDLSREQVAAARAYVLNHADTVLARHVEIESRLAAGNPDELAERAQETHARFVRFKERVSAREGLAAETAANTMGSASPAFPSFGEWLGQQSSPSTKAI